MVSCTCNSKESSCAITEAIPPWAYLVADSSKASLVIIPTEPNLQTLRANVNPATPEPITIKFFLIAIGELYRIIP